MLEEEWTLPVKFFLVNDNFFLRITSVLSDLMENSYDEITDYLDPFKWLFFEVKCSKVTSQNDWVVTGLISYVCEWWLGVRMG